MRSIVVKGEWDGRRLTRFLQKALPAAGMGQIQRFLRLGRVKIDGKRADENAVLRAGQQVDLYVEDRFFDAPAREDPFYSKIRPRLTILYEDEHVLLLDKRAGLICHPDEGEKIHTLLTYAQAYLYQKGEWSPQSGFVPALCNRIDRLPPASSSSPRMRTRSERWTPKSARMRCRNTTSAPCMAI